MNIAGEIIEVGNLENGGRGFVMRRAGGDIAVTGLTEDEARAVSPHYGRCVTVMLAGVAPRAAEPALAEAMHPSVAFSNSDELYPQAVEVVRAQQRVSISLVRRHLRIGYNRAQWLIERMERDGIAVRVSTGWQFSPAPGAAA